MSNRNEERADQAEEAINVASDNEPSEKETSLSDTLASLRHWADRHGISFDAAVDHSERAYSGDFEDGPKVERISN